MTPNSSVLVTYSFFASIIDKESHCFSQMHFSLFPHKILLSYLSCQESQHSASEYSVKIITNNIELITLLGGREVFM